MIAALACGLFYGAFFLWVAQRADERKRMDRMYARGMKRLRTSVREFDERDQRKYVRADTLPYPAAELAELDEGCLCDECCDCGTETMSHVGIWAGASSWPASGQTVQYDRAGYCPDGHLSKVICTGFEDE